MLAGVEFVEQPSIVQTDVITPSDVYAADLDGDGDIDILSASEGDAKIAWYENTDGAGTFGPPHVITTSWASSVYAADLDGDGDNDVLSAGAWYENLGSPAQPGDANMDGEVNFADFTILANNFGRDADVVFADGDFDEDGDVDFSDFLILADNFGRRQEAAATPVPSLSLAAVDAGHAEAVSVEPDIAAALDSAIDQLEPTTHLT